MILTLFMGSGQPLGAVFGHVRRVSLLDVGSLSFALLCAAHRPLSPSSVHTHARWLCAVVTPLCRATQQPVTPECLVPVTQHPPAPRPRPHCSESPALLLGPLWSSSTRRGAFCLRGDCPAELVVAGEALLFAPGVLFSVGPRRSCSYTPASCNIGANTGEKPWRLTLGFWKPGNCFVLALLCPADSSWLRPPGTGARTSEASEPSPTPPGGNTDTMTSDPVAWWATALLGDGLGFLLQIFPWDFSSLLPENSFTCEIFLDHR